jgi:excisionase family DNA binding protein
MQIVQDGVTVIVQPILTFFRPVESPRETPSDLMTTEETAAYLRVHPDTLRKWVRLGKIPRVPMPGAGKDFRFRRQSLDEWAKGRELR